MSNVKLVDLSVGYGKKVVASHINASVQSGKLTCLMGRNGVGKSTLLRTIAGFQPKLFGQIFIGNNEIGSFANRQLSRLISIVLTEKADVHNLTVGELVGLGRSPYTGFWGKLSPADHEIIERCLSLVGMTAFKNRKIQQLSDGEKQKIMIAKSLAQETPVILLDEPTAFLDFQSKVEMLRLLRRLASEMRKTIFLSSHEAELSMQIADVVWLITAEKGLITGTPKELSENGTFARFIENEGIKFHPETMNITIL